jgi:hypothetical protein
VRLVVRRCPAQLACLKPAQLGFQVMALLRLQAAANRLPGLLDVLRVLWLVPHQLLAAFAVCSTAAAASVLSARHLMAGGAGVAERAARAGHDLYLGTVLNQGRRATLARRVRLTQRDLRLLALLLDVRFLSTSQLVMLGFGPSGERAGQRRLKLLLDGCFVERFRPPRAAGSSEWTYRLAARGFKELAAAQMTAGNRRYGPPAISDVSAVRHDLELAALVLRIALDAGRKESTAGLIDGMPFEWRGPRTGRIERTNSARFEGFEAATLPPDARLHPEQSPRCALKPDATLIGGPPHRRFSVLLEYDCTLRPHKHAGRLRRYDAWLLDGWRDTHFATHAVAPVMFVLTVCEALVGPLIETADRVLNAWQGHRQDGREGGYRARERIVFTSRERLLSGDWTVQQVPSLPPSLRGGEDTCTPRSRVYDLPSMLREPVALSRVGCKCAVGPSASRDASKACVAAVGEPTAVAM